MKDDIVRLSEIKRYENYCFFRLYFCLHSQFNLGVCLLLEYSSPATFFYADDFQMGEAGFAIDAF